MIQIELLRVQNEGEIEIFKWFTEIGVRWYGTLTNPPKSIGELTNLQNLCLRWNQLTSIPESISELTNLKWLDLGGNELASIPESIGQLTNLQELDLNSNQLTSIPESIGQLTNLQELDLNSNQLASIPESIGQLTNLQKLELRGNQLTSIPESIGQLTNLQELNLEWNQLTSLPQSIGQLTNLQKLELRGNQLTSIPESIGQLTNLQKLDLNSNQLTSIPDSIGQLTNLECLNLGENQPTSTLQRLTQTDLEVYFQDVELPRRYWTQFSDWEPEWLLDEDNAEIRRVLIQQVGYEKICDRLAAEPLDTWQEYELLKIDAVEAVYLEDEPMVLYQIRFTYPSFTIENPNSPHPAIACGSGSPLPSLGEGLGVRDRVKGFFKSDLVLLKMTCPSTGHIHLLRVPPEMKSAEAAITWVNHGIHPDDFAIQT